MFSRRLKTGFFVLEGLNSFSTSLFFYYFYFYTAHVYGYGNKLNLVLAALNGVVYAVFSLYGGRFAQRFGYFTALKTGFFVMLSAAACASQVHSAPAHIVLVLVADAGMCFTWPALEAMVCEGESRAGVQRMVGTYNVVWAGTGALGYFLGGAILQNAGLQSLFYLPAAIMAVEFALTILLERLGRREAGCEGPGAGGERPGAAEEEPHPHSREETQCFLRMAWLANPFAYISVNTLVAVMPGIANSLGLSTMAAGFCCSVWCFARLGAFAVLWRWGGWHYRFNWLLASYLALVGSFVSILLVRNLAVLVVAQLAFGWALGLIYYSSLFYSMDRSDTKGEHGGIHEAAIGMGNFAGPALGAVSLHFLPQYANSGAIAVTLLLLGGLGGLVWIRGGGRAHE